MHLLSDIHYWYAFAYLHVDVNEPEVVWLLHSHFIPPSCRGSHLAVVPASLWSPPRRSPHGPRHAVVHKLNADEVPV